MYHFCDAASIVVSVACISCCSKYIPHRSHLHVQHKYLQKQSSINKCGILWWEFCYASIGYKLMTYSGVQHILCFSSYCVPYVASFSRFSIFDCPFGILQRLFTVSLDGTFLIANSVFSNVYLQFLWTVHFWLSIRYSLTFIYSFSGRYIFDCQFGIL
jgi:hypothetical protein